MMKSHERQAGRLVRYAVVGAGWISQEAFLPGVHHTGNSTVTALVTGDAKKANALGAKYGISRVYDYGGYDRMLASGEVDAIYLALPNTMHRDFATRALRAGIHVLCEKPMAPNEDDCHAMIEAARLTKAKLMIAYRLHFEEATLAALEATRSGRIGDARLFTATFTQQVSRKNHRSKSQFWAGPLPDMGPYPINMARHVFAAEPTEAIAFGASAAESRFSEIDEMLSVALRFPGERLALFAVSFGADAVDEYRIVGTKGDLRVSPGFGLGQAYRHWLTVDGHTAERSFAAVDQFGGETKYFSDCILQDRTPEPNGEEGLADVRVLAAIEMAARTGVAQEIGATARRAHPTQSQVVSLEPVAAPELVHAAPPGQG
jgi:predicted dehydrogenase